MLADTIPLYALYALLFADSGMSDAQISSLFLIWSAVGIVAEVPSGALADRFPRRAALVASGVFQAAGYVAWIAMPGYPGFAAGFALWGLGGALSSGALEALLYDGMAALGAEAYYPNVYSRVAAVGLLSQIPVAASATVLFSSGGYGLVGWASVACCLAAAGVATRIPEASPGAAPRAIEERGSVDQPDRGYFATLRAGAAEAARMPAARAAVIAVALVGGLDGLEEYLPLLAQDWGVATSWVPLALLGVPLAGAAGASLGGVASGLRPRRLASLLAGSVVVFAGAAVIHRPVAVVGVALAYGLYQLVLVVVGTRLQQRIDGSCRATVTSVAALGTEISALALYAAWALGQTVVVALIALAMAASLPQLLRARPRRAERSL